MGGDQRLHESACGQALSGLAVEYRILEIYSRDAGQRAAKISFNVGQGTPGHRLPQRRDILFNAVPARAHHAAVKDENGQPTMASFMIRDRLNRSTRCPPKRLAPDFFFQPQIYRADGETVHLPAGYYTVESTGGPGVLPRTTRIRRRCRRPARVLVPAGALDRSCEVRLVFRRPPRPRRRLLALHEPDRRRAARRT